MSQLPRVLMIDDDHVDIYSVRRAIKQQKPAILFEAIKYSQDFLRQIDNYVDLPDAVLLDINMPVVSGFQILDSIQLHDRWKKIPVLMLTTSDEPQERQACMDAGATAFLTKPHTQTEMDSVLLELKLHLFKGCKKTMKLLESERQQP